MRRSIVRHAAGPLAIAMACSCESGAADECPASTTQPSDGAVCLCAPFDVAGPPDFTAGAPVTDWAISAGGEGDDGARITALPAGEVLVLTTSSDQDAPKLSRMAADGRRTWEIVMPARAPQVAATASGAIFTLFEHDLSGDVTVGGRTLGDADRGLSFMAGINGQTGAFEDVIEVPPGEGDAWPGFEIDASGFYELRRSGQVGHIYRRDLSGAELWHEQGELGDLASSSYPLGGIVVAGGAQGALVVRRLDTDTDETWQYVHPGFEDPVVGVQAIGTSSTGRIAVAFTLTRTDEDSGESESISRAVAFDDAASVTMNVGLTSPATGIAYVSDSEVVVWRAALPADPGAWLLTQYALDGTIDWTWTLPARSDYARLGPNGDLDLRDAFLFASGAYVGGLDLGRENQIDAAGCTDHFVTRFAF